MREWLRVPILETNQPLKEVQAFTESRVPKLPPFQTAAEFQSYAADLREEVLTDIVFRGGAKEWRNKPLKVEWLATIDGGPEYRIRKLRYEALPGLWIPALLYEPLKLQDRVPAVLNVNGHEGIGKAVDYKQIRCINEAKRGMLAMNVEWLGMGQLRGSNFAHYAMNQLDLCGTSGLAPFYLAMARGLDVLLSHAHADSNRVAVAGLSGGGWQTIVLSALDTRVTLANPVAGYSSFRTRARYIEDLGDSEQTPNDLATVADYTHLTALLAPRAALLTYNAKDNCCFASGHALQPLLDAARPIYRLFDKENQLRFHVNEVPGDHNFGADNRRALYEMFQAFFSNSAQTYDPAEIAAESELKTYEQLEVELPADNAHLRSLAAALCKELPRDPALPTQRDQLEAWQISRREQLDELLQARPYRFSPVLRDTRRQDDLTAQFWQMRVRSDWTVPVLDCAVGTPAETVILLHDQGRAETWERAASLIAAGKRVMAVDLFYFGESKIRDRDYLYALLVAAIGERPLGLQASQLNALARWASTRYRQDKVIVEAFGRRSSLIALAAAALKNQNFAAIELHDSLGSLRQVIEEHWTVDQRPEWFCFGLLEHFDIRQMAALAWPTAIKFHEPSSRLEKELGGWDDWKKQMASPDQALK